MKNTLVKIAQGAGIAAGLTAATVVLAVGGSEYLDHIDPMGGAVPGYVVVRSGDTSLGLCKKEGWTKDEMYAHGVQNWSPSIFSGNIMEIPQKEGNPYDTIGDTERPVYESAEDAEASKLQ